MRNGIARLAHSLAIVSLALARSPHVQITLEARHQINLDFGEPRQGLRKAILNTKFRELVVIDNECGVRDRGCPAFCDDELLARLYCPAMCSPMTSHSRLFTCVDSRYRYSHKDSKFARLFGDRLWQPMMSSSRKLFGRFFRDRVELHQFEMKRPIGSELGIHTFNATFVSALTFDNRLLFSASALFGLAPGPKSAAVEFLKGLKLPKHRLSLSMNRPGDVIRHPTRKAHQLGRSFLTLGAVDMWRCVAWNWVPLVGADEFAILAAVDFLGVRFENVMLNFAIDNQVIFMPEPMADVLIERGKIKILQEVLGIRIYSFECKISQPLRFLDSNNRPFLQFDNNSLTIPNAIYARMCGMMAVVDTTLADAQPRYSQIMTIGSLLLEEHCLALDYDGSAAGLAVRRPWAHPWLIDGMALKKEVEA